jgi:hypothetical protein
VQGSIIETLHSWAKIVQQYPEVSQIAGARGKGKEGREVREQSTLMCSRSMLRTAAGLAACRVMASDGILVQGLTLSIRATHLSACWHRAANKSKSKKRTQVSTRDATTPKGSGLSQTSQTDQRAHVKVVRRRCTFSYVLKGTLFLGGRDCLLEGRVCRPCIACLPAPLGNGEKMERG